MMGGNYRRTPIGASLPRIARETADTQLQKTAKALPCTVVSVNGQFVTVKFEVDAGPFTLQNITIPINTSKYDWIPVQSGDTGYTQPANVALANISGVTTSIPALVQSGNLTGLAFQPAARKQFTAVNSNQRVVQGPAGARVQTLDGAVIIEVGETVATITIGSLVFTATGSGVAIVGNLTVTGEITAGFGTGDSVTLQQHRHGAAGTLATGTTIPTPGT